MQHAHLLLHPYLGEIRACRSGSICSLPSGAVFTAFSECVETWQGAMATRFTANTLVVSPPSALSLPPRTCLSGGKRCNRPVGAEEIDSGVGCPARVMAHCCCARGRSGSEALLIDTVVARKTREWASSILGHLRACVGSVGFRCWIVGRRSCLSRQRNPCVFLPLPTTAHINTRERCATYFPPVGSLDLVHPHFLDSTYVHVGGFASFDWQCVCFAMPATEARLFGSVWVGRAG